MRFTRRNVLKLSGGTFALAFVGAGFTGWSWFRERAPGTGFSVLSDEEAAVVVALCEVHFPPGTAIGKVVDVQLATAGVDDQLASLPRFERRLARSLLALVDRWPHLRLFSGRRFRALSFEQRVAAMRTLEASSSPSLRGIAEVTRIIVGLSVFEQPLVLAEIGHSFGCAVRSE